MRRLIPSLPRSAWQLLAAGLPSAVANGLTYPFLVVYLHRVRELPLGLAGMAAATIAVAAIAVNLAARRRPVATRLRCAASLGAPAGRRRGTARAPARMRRAASQAWGVAFAP